MQKVEHSLLPINYLMAAENLEKKAAIIGQKQKELSAKPEWLATIHRLIYFENSRLKSLGRECQHLLDKIEKVPTIFSPDENKTAEQKRYYSALLKTTNLVTSILSLSKSKGVKNQLEMVMQRVAGLKYRIEAANGGLDRVAVDPLLTGQLSAAALQWKQNHPLIVKKEITEQEIKKLEDTSTYQEFARLLLSSQPMQEAFFSLLLRDNNDVAQLVEFPATSARLKSCYLASRVGKIVGSYQIRKEEKEEGVVEKVVTLPFFTRNKTEHISILDESRVVELDDRMGGTKSFTINQIFNVFAMKNREIGDLEILKDGIMYWNCYQLGSIDLTCDEWWKQLPLIEEITKEQMEQRVDEALNPGEWVVFAKSSRTTPDLDLDGRHGYLEVAIPTEDGKYRVYPFGIFPHILFPTSILELVTFLGMTNRAKIGYPDANFFYSHRQQASHPMRLLPDEAQAFMKNLQKELIKSRYGHLIFQFGAENCAYWAQIILNTIVAKKHNFFKIDYVKSYPLNPLLKKIFGFFRSLPNFCRNSAIAVVDRCFGTARGIWVLENRQRVFKTHHTSHVRNEFVIYQPGYLHQQIAEGKIKGYIYLGNC